MAIHVLIGLATACDAPGQEPVLIFSSPGTADGFAYAITDDSIVMSELGRIVELERDGTFRATITEQPFLRMAAGHGWVAWSDVVALGDSRFTSRFTRRSARGIEVAAWPLESGNVDMLLATPEGIVIRDTYQSNLWLWGANAIEPIELAASDLYPAVFDDGWVYAIANTAGYLIRFRLDGSQEESIVSIGGPTGAVAFGVSGSRFVYATHDYPAMSLTLLDLATREQRELGEVPHSYALAIAVSDDHVFADTFRAGDELERFLPTGARIARLDVIGDSLCWSTETSPYEESAPAFSLYCAGASGEALASPTGDDDARPPWL